jgi:long-chain acyl-CoA synthetase
MVTLLVPLFLGAKVTYGTSLRPDDLTQIIKETKVTILVGVPQLFALIHKAIFEKIKKIPFFLRSFVLPFIKSKVQNNFGKSLRLLVSGGARLEPKVAGGLSRLGFKIIEGYGLTETSPVVTINPPQKIKFGSVGKPIPDVEIKISSSDASGIGEVLIKGPNVMQGYFKQPDLSKEIIKEGWFYSGDLGYIDKEGYLFLVGRKKDVIVLSSGKNIYPEELEEYYSSSPYIKEICILSKTEEKFGRIQDYLYAIIVPDLEYFHLKNEKNIRAKIRWELENLAKNLPNYKHIMGFTITKEELPRTRLKKIKRYLVSQIYFKEEVLPRELPETIFSEEDRKTIDTHIAQKIISYLSKELKKPIYLDSHLEIDLGIDSLSRVELGLGLEALLSISIPDNFMDNISTVKEAIMNIQNIINKTTPEIYEAKKEPKTWSQILKAPPPDIILKKIRIESRLLDKIIGFIFKSIFLFIFKIFWFLRIKGRGSIPSSGPYILCPNHASYLDGFFIFCSLPMRSAINTFFIGYAAIFEHPFVSWAIKTARLIPLDPNTHLTEAMQATAYILRHKKIICIFPEGGRSISEEIEEFKKGIGILAKELNIPVIPIYIKGSHYSWPRGKKFPCAYPVKIIFGQPFDFKILTNQGLRQGAKDEYEAIALGLREEVIRLKERRG